jgi:FtsH-binding integral membrane protein
MNMTEAVKTPWHLWVVGVLGLLWNLIAVTDYTFAKMKSDWYMKEVGQFTAEQIAWFGQFPLWANIGWALGVWGSFLGSLLLLARSRHAVAAFLVSAAGLLAMTIYQFVLKQDEFTGLFGSGPMYFNIVIWVILIALFLYARAMAAKGVLR